jgi:predicted hotdog family 3-hydroxylacyl-ACP dehydratase
MTLPALEQLLPHRAPMCLLDRVRRFDPPGVVCELVVRDDSLFVRDGRVEGVIALEYMAQAAGVCTALTLRSEGKPVPMGYLVSVPKMDLHVVGFSVGDALEVRAAPVYKGTSAGAFDCEVRRGGETVASATLMVLAREEAS